MNKKWGILSVSILLAILAGVLWLTMSGGKSIIVQGNLSAQDLAEIKNVVKKDMRKRIFPDMSWASLKGLLPNLNAYAQYNIREIDAYNNDNARVLVGKSTNTPSSRKNCQYVLHKNDKGWTISFILPANSGVMVRSAGLPTSLIARPPPGTIRAIAPASPPIAFRAGIPQPPMQETNLSLIWATTAPPPDFPTNLPFISWSGNSRPFGPVGLTVDKSITDLSLAVTDSKRIRYTATGAAALPIGVSPTSPASLTNLMPLSP